jgi:hypothetical protein
MHSQYRRTVMRALPRADRASLNMRRPTMDGKRPIDRVREIERKNQPRFDGAKERVARGAARLAQDARTHDDEEQRRALEAAASRDRPASRAKRTNEKARLPMRNRNTHRSDSRDEGGSGDAKTKRTAKQMTRKTTSRGAHRGRSSGSASRRRSGSRSNAS